MNEENKTLQLSAVSKKQTDLIKANFKGNDFLLKAVRNLFYGFALTEMEIDVIKKTFSGNSELCGVVRKKIFPLFEDTIDLDTGLAADYWLDVEKDILGAHSSAIYQRISSKQMCFDMLEQAIGLLENPTGTKVDMSYAPNLATDEWQVKLLARSLYIRTIGQGLALIKIIADQVEQTSAEIAKKKALNSTK